MAVSGLKRVLHDYISWPLQLRIFCVSNKVYEQYRLGPDKDEVPDLSVEATGIPELRSWLLGLPAARKLAALRNYISSRIPLLITGTLMFCSDNEVQHKERLIKLISSKASVCPVRRCQGFANNSSSQFR